MLLYLVKHLAAVKFSRHTDLECACLRYQLLLNTICVTRIMKPLQKGGSGCVSSTFSRHCWSCGRVSREHPHPWGCRTPTPTHTTAASSPLDHLLCAPARHWADSPSQIHFWFFSHNLAAESVSSVRSHSSSVPARPKGQGESWATLESTPSSVPLLQQWTKPAPVDSLLLAGKWTYSLLLY